MPSRSNVRSLAAVFAIGLAWAGAAPNGQAETLGPEQRIDRLIEAKLTEKGLHPNPPVDDATFLRRIYLDLNGRIPTLEEAANFHADSREGRRGRLINKLLDSEGYVSHFYNFWADILRINARLGINETPAAVEYAYRLWLKKALRENKPYDAFVRELVSARGHFWENGAVGYYQRDRGMPLDNMSNTVRIFLGTRLECAQCHNHPFDHWTQMDYYHMAAFSYGMESKGHTHPNREALRAHMERAASDAYAGAVGVKEFPRFNSAAELDAFQRKLKQSGQWYSRLAGLELSEDEFIAAAKRGIAALEACQKRAQSIRSAEDNLHVRVRYVTTREYDRVLRLPHDYQYRDAKPHDEVAGKTMFGGEIAPDKSKGATIEAYADWLTSRDNPTFTRVIANRLWSRLFGVGVFEPQDDISAGAEVSHPELMTCLEDLMRDLDYDMKAFLAVICNTQAYQRAVTTQELALGEHYYFQGPLLRRMSAEQIWDSVAGMVLPENDYFRPNLVRQLEAINRTRLIYANLADVPADEYISVVKALGETADRITSQLARVREERTRARLEKNDSLSVQKAAEEKALTAELGAEISRIQQRLHREDGGANLLARVGMVEMAPGSHGASSGAVPSGVPVVTVLPKPKYPRAPAGLAPDQLKAWADRTRAEYLQFVKFGADWPRASELDSPAPYGHFLRDFGQSDRVVIENASNLASVPQALNMLNGPMAEALMNRFTVLGRRLHAAEAPEEKAVLVFQAMLTRPPNEEEMMRIRAEIERHGDSACEDLLWALLNTQRFLFIQ
jgi:hypothetical protein